MSGAVRKLRVVAPELTRDGFREAVLTGLAKPQKAIPSRFFYDYRGSELFEEITRLEAYYPTRTEIAILRDALPAIAESLGPRAAVVEFGAGASRKTRALLAALEQPAAYVPIDIAGEYLAAAVEGLARELPEVAMLPVEADFTAPLSLPPLPPHRLRLGFFPGSTVGNLTPAEALRFLVRAREALGSGSKLLIGVDTRKDVAVLERAYDDPDGVTAAFNLNLLVRANRELGADFAVDRFEHAVVWNDDHSRIEMHLLSRGTQTVHVDGRRFAFAAGETIHTESSYKYAPREFRLLARAAGWQTEGLWQDGTRLFSVHLLSSAPGRVQDAA